MILNDLNAARRNRENIALMRELERQGLGKKSARPAIVRPTQGHHQKKKPS